MFNSEKKDIFKTAFYFGKDEKQKQSFKLDMSKITREIDDDDAPTPYFTPQKQQTKFPNEFESTSTFSMNSSQTPKIPSHMKKMLKKVY